jgi:hypothetical protein
MTPGQLYDGILKAMNDKEAIDLIEQAKSEWCEKQRERDAYLASYKGGLSKVEIWNLKQDELCDKIEDLILNAPEL